VVQTKKGECTSLQNIKGNITYSLISHIESVNAMLKLLTLVVITK